MSKSIIIRHAKTRQSWDTLPYRELIRLIRHETDPEIDKDFLEKNLDLNKIKKLKLKKVYSSPRKRAVQTAEYISRIMKSRVMIVPELDETKFDKIPHDEYIKGKESIREFLFKKSIRMNINRRMHTIKSLINDNAIIVTHGFMMRLIFSQIFNKNPNQLREDKRFTQYLCGFECSKGKCFSLLKKRGNR